jgi:hypothetical protein
MARAPFHEIRGQQPGAAIGAEETGFIDRCSPRGRQTDVLCVPLGFGRGASRTALVGLRPIKPASRSCPFGFDPLAVHGMTPSASLKSRDSVNPAPRGRFSICPTCQRPWPRHATNPATDEEIILGLIAPKFWSDFSSSWFDNHWLYVAGRGRAPGAQWDEWFLTGPQERPGYVQGPFPLEQVQRLIESGRLKPEVVAENGDIYAWTANRDAICRSCGGKRAPGSAAQCRACYRGKTAP